MNYKNLVTHANSAEINEECGVCGIINTDHAGHDLYLGLHALQHRGQEASGISTFQDGKLTHVVKREGSIVNSFTAQDVSRLVGNSGLGHVRYSTFGGSDIANLQPFVFRLRDFAYGLVHNGNLTNANNLRDFLEKHGSIFFSRSDSEILGHLINRNYNQNNFLKTLKDSLHYIEGAFCYIIAFNNHLYGCRDKYGLRPLALGKLPGSKGYVLASESVAFDILNATFVRDLKPGEMIEITPDGKINSAFYARHTRNCICAMEYVYFSRPDSVVEGQSVHAVRVRLGARLAKDHPVAADVVIGVPDSSSSAAIGYAQASGLNYELGLIKNRYIGRSFIMPSQAERERIVKMKLNVNARVVAGKRIVLVDDSIVRGTTMRAIIKLLRTGGAREIHVRISSPPIRWPCFYGVDTSREKELVLRHTSTASFRKSLQADSLAFLGKKAFQETLGRTFSKTMCGACFTGEYIAPLVDQHIRKQEEDHG